MAAIDGETVGTARDLASEQSHLNAILEALPFLDDYAIDGDANEWDVAEPEHALALVEALPTLSAIAGLDWPKGQPVRVITLDSKHLTVSVKSEREWFRISGRGATGRRAGARFRRVVGSREQPEPFHTDGERRYVALTNALEERLADLGAVMETDKHGAAPASACRRLGG